MSVISEVILERTRKTSNALSMIRRRRRRLLRVVFFTGERLRVHAHALISQTAIL
jgi:hypothetical protein